MATAAARKLWRDEQSKAAKPMQPGQGKGPAGTPCPPGIASVPGTQHERTTAASGRVSAEGDKSFSRVSAHNPLATPASPRGSQHRLLHRSHILAFIHVGNRAGPFLFATPRARSLGHGRHHLIQTVLCHSLFLTQVLTCRGPGIL